MFKKVNLRRAATCLLILLMVFTVWGYAESALQGQYMEKEIIDQAQVDQEVKELQQAATDPEINVIDGLKKIVNSTG